MKGLPIQLILLAGLLPGMVGATMRDPTEPPAEVRAAASAGTPEAGDTEAPSPRHIIVTNGRSYVVYHGQRLGVGDLLGTARVERITSDAVWLRDGELVRRVPLYTGVTKRPLTAAPSASAPRTDMKRPTKKDQL